MVQYSYSTTSIHQLYIVRFFDFFSLLCFQGVSGVRLGHHYITAVRLGGGQKVAGRAKDKQSWIIVAEQKHNATLSDQRRS